MIPRIKASMAHHMLLKKNMMRPLLMGINGMLPQRYSARNASEGRIESYLGLSIPAKINLKSQSWVITNVYMILQRTRNIN